MSDEKERETKEQPKKQLGYWPYNIPTQVKEFLTGTKKGIDTCENLTRNRSACKGVSNFFVSGTDKKDCNWFCLKDCTPEQLRPMFENLPSYLEVSDVKVSSLNEKLPRVDKLPITLFYWGFELDIEHTLFFKMVIIKDVSEKLFKITIFSSNRKHRISNVNIEQLVSDVCSFLKFIKILNNEITFLSTVSFNKDINNGYNTWKFDKNFLRPMKYWEYFINRPTKKKMLNEIAIRFQIN